MMTRKYMNQLEHCMNAMAKGEGSYRNLKVDTYLVRVKHCQKHYIFGLVESEQPILILALFHESMDLMNRLKTRLK